MLTFPNSSCLLYQRTQTFGDDAGFLHRQQAPTLKLTEQPKRSTAPYTLRHAGLLLKMASGPAQAGSQTQKKPGGTRPGLSLVPPATSGASVDSALRPTTYSVRMLALNIVTDSSNCERCGAVCAPLQALVRRRARCRTRPASTPRRAPSVRRLPAYQEPA